MKISPNKILLHLKFQDNTFHRYKSKGLLLSSVTSTKFLPCLIFVPLSCILSSPERKYYGDLEFSFYKFFKDFGVPKLDSRIKMQTNKFLKLLTRTHSSMSLILLEPLTHSKRRTPEREE